MEGETFFLDTYAIQEILEGNERYKKFTEQVRLITSKLNLMEIYHNILKKKGEDDAESAFNEFADICVGITDDDLKQAVKFKASIKNSNSKSNISYIDAIGYTLAKKYNVKFLTGDREFKGMDNVEFVA